MKASELEKKFGSPPEPMTEDEARAEASRCLYCWDPPCACACPSGVSVPDFIRKIMTGNYLGAARQLYEKNCLAGGCARVCPVEEFCEGSCVQANLQGRPVAIARLQRFASDWAIANRAPVLRPGAPTGRRVAIIGAGPSGYACAVELARLGHAVTMFEARPKDGGLYTHGIARYKLSSDYTFAELRMLRRLGIRLKTSVKFGGDVSFEDLMKRYDAVFLGIGRGRSAALRVPGEDLRGVVEGMSFLEKPRTLPLEKIRVGRRVVVVGGGNTAVDAAMAASRLGAKDVFIVYRRTREEMPAYSGEYEHALLEGIRFEWLAAPSRILGVKKVEGIECIRMKLAAPDASGRPRPVPVPGSEFVIECDMVITALGQTALDDVFSRIPGLKLKGGLVVVNPRTGATSVRRLFAGGDCVNGGAEMVNAVAEGVRAARGMDQEIRLKNHE